MFLPSQLLKVLFVFPMKSLSQGGLSFHLLFWNIFKFVGSFIFLHYVIEWLFIGRVLCHCEGNIVSFGQVHEF
jgi:hypothetical protein